MNNRASQFPPNSPLSPVFSRNNRRDLSHMMRIGLGVQFLQLWFLEWERWAIASWSTRQILDELHFRAGVLVADKRWEQVWNERDPNCI